MSAIQRVLVTRSEQSQKSRLDNLSHFVFGIAPRILWIEEIMASKQASEKRIENLGNMDRPAFLESF